MRRYYIDDNHREGIYIYEILMIWSIMWIGLCIYKSQKYLHLPFVSCRKRKTDGKLSLCPNPRERDSRASRVISELEGLRTVVVNNQTLICIWTSGNQKSCCCELCSAKVQEPGAQMSKGRKTEIAQFKRVNKDSFYISCYVLPSTNLVIPNFVGKVILCSLYWFQCWSAIEIPL